MKHKGFLFNKVADGNVDGGGVEKNDGVKVNSIEWECVRIVVPEECLVAVDMMIEGKSFVGVINKGLWGIINEDVKGIRGLVNEDVEEMRGMVDEDGVSGGVWDEVFGWYLSVIIDYEGCVGEGMPDVDQTRRMQDFSDFLSEGLAGDVCHPNALFLGRVTGDGYTQIMWYVNDPEVADSYLQGVIDSKAYAFDFSYEMTFDGDREEAAYWLRPLSDSTV